VIMDMDQIDMGGCCLHPRTKIMSTAFPPRLVKWIETLMVRVCSTVQTVNTSNEKNRELLRDNRFIVDYAFIHNGLEINYMVDSVGKVLQKKQFHGIPGGFGQGSKPKA
jgi:hypothetical protein